MGWTFQSLIDGNMTITVYCHNSACNHGQTLDLEKLRDRFGPDAPAMAADLQGRFRCTVCKGMETGLTYAPDTEAMHKKFANTPKPNLYAKAKGK